MKKGKNHIKVSSTNILCSESNGSQGWLPLQVKIETEARFLAKRLASEATGDLVSKKHFSALFYYAKKCMHFLANAQRKFFKTLTNRQFHARIM